MRAAGPIICYVRIEERARLGSLDKVLRSLWVSVGYRGVSAGKSKNKKETCVSVRVRVCVYVCVSALLPSDALLRASPQVCPKAFFRRSPLFRTI